MASEANVRGGGLRAALAARRLSPEGALAWRALWTSRVLVWVAGTFAVLEVGRASGTLAFDPGGLTEPFGYLGDLLAAPGARWDSAWYLGIADHGYREVAQTAFFPLYPLLAWLAGLPLGSSLTGGLLVSFAAFAVALVLLQRLVTLELGARYARPAVLILAFSPAALFFSAVYTESLFLALSLGAVLAARGDRWALAGVLGALAAATRNTGVLLALPLVMMAGRRPRALWVLLVPAGLGVYLGYLGLRGFDVAEPFRVGHLWFRSFAPLGGLIDGATAAWDGLRQLAHGARFPVYWRHAGGDPFAVAGMSLMLFAWVPLAAGAAWLVLRRLPRAYGAYTVAALLVALSFPVGPQPLASFPRYLLVIFPLWLAVAAWAEDRRRTEVVVGMGALGLGVFTVLFATWRFVA